MNMISSNKEDSAARNVDVAPNKADFVSNGAVQASWTSLFNSMDYWAKQKEPVPPQMINLVHEAQYFASKYLEFFNNIPLEQEELDQFSEAKIRSQALESVLNEWDTIRHALEQRTNPRYKTTLISLDQLAVECLLPLFGEEKLSRGIFTYLHKLFDINRFAFSNIPLIGAPYSALHSPESWLAIPHEAGHYIFWNNGETLVQFNLFYMALEDNILRAIGQGVNERKQSGYFRRTGIMYQQWLDWTNEIFADLFGVLVAGPAFAWSNQAMLRAPFCPSDLKHSHEAIDHPNPFIRPFFQIYALREMEANSDGAFGGDLARAAGELETSWRDSWGRDRIQRFPTPENIGSMEDVLAKEVHYVVKAILDTRLGIHPDTPDTLRYYFENQQLYSQKRHADIKEAVGQIAADMPPTASSLLTRSAAAQLAISQGCDPDRVHLLLGFEGPASPISEDPKLDERFAQFIANVTASPEKENQKKNWNRVLNYSLAEQAFHWHSHPHDH